MINTKNINKTQKMGLTPEQRKKKVATLREEHEDYFQKEGKINALYIPKMAYRPSGKDELHVSFFPSELEKGRNIYTEFVSIDYDTEDPKRTLYFLKHNPHWKEEYELVTSNSGFERHIIPVSELKIINDVNSRRSPIKNKVELKDFIKVKDPEKREIVDVLIGIERALLSINKKLIKR